MIGAPLLAGRAALQARRRQGLGRASPHASIPAVDWGAPELMLRAADAVLGAGADALVLRARARPDDARAATRRRVCSPHRVPLVLDADALNLIAADPPLRAALSRARGADAADAASGRSGAPARDTDVADGPARPPRARRRRLRANSTPSVVAQGRRQRARASRRHVGHQRERQSRARDRRLRRRARGLRRRVPRAGPRREGRAAARRVPARRRGRRAGRARAAVRWASTRTCPSCVPARAARPVERASALKAAGSSRRSFRAIRSARCASAASFSANVCRGSLTILPASTRSNSSSAIAVEVLALRRIT